MTTGRVPACRQAGNKTGRRSRREDGAGGSAEALTYRVAELDEVRRGRAPLVERHAAPLRLARAGTAPVRQLPLFGAAGEALCGQRHHCPGRVGLAAVTWARDARGA